MDKRAAQGRVMTSVAKHLHDEVWAVGAKSVAFTLFWSALPLQYLNSGYQQQVEGGLVGRERGRMNPGRSPLGLNR